jgi:Bacterial Ig-like domain (group 2)/IPT/TIG domain
MIAGGTTCASPGCPTASTELYYNSFFYYPTYPTGNMTVARFGQTATLLTNGQVLFAGGFDSCASSCISDQTTELFDPVAVTFTSSQNLSTGRSGHTATLLTDGSVLLVGGINNGLTLSSTDSYQRASLAPAQLVSITVSQSNPITVGQTSVLSATGNFSDGSTSPLQSVIWSSSSPSVATISNAAGSAGIVNALSAGNTTITATVGTIVGSTTITATASLVSITVTPSSQTVTIGSNQPLTATATGTYADGSTLDVTSQTTWGTSNTSIATVLENPGSPAVLVPATAGTTTLSASVGTISGSTTVVVNAPIAPVPPNIGTVSPAAGAAGTQVTITGSGFGATQGSGMVWLGTNLGTVVSWSDTQVVANVSTGSSSGVAQIQQTNGASNSVTFTINTAAIVGVSPNNGLPGTQ